MQIVRADEDDLCQILEVFEKSIRMKASANYSPDQINVWLGSKNNIERWKEKINKDYYLVAKVAKEIIGFSSLKNTQNTIAYLDMMYVISGYTNQKIALKLLNGIESFAVEQGVKIIETDASKTAINFFSRNAYEIVKENKLEINGVKINNFRMRKLLSSKNTMHTPEFLKILLGN